MNGKLAKTVVLEIDKNVTQRKPGGHSQVAADVPCSMRDLRSIIEAALNGGTPRSVSARVPTTADEIVADGVACIDAGASIIHNHNTEPVLGGDGNHAAAPYATIWTRIRARHPEAIFYPTMAGGGNGIPIERRYAHIESLVETGLLDLGLVDTGSTNIGRFYADGTPRAESLVYQNTFADAVYMIETCRRHGLGMSISIFEPGFVRVISGYLRAGKLPPGAFVKFYFGGAKAGFGLPPTKTALTRIWKCSRVDAAVARFDSGRRFDREPQLCNLRDRTRRPSAGRPRTESRSIQAQRRSGRRGGVAVSGTGQAPCKLPRRRANCSGSAVLLLIRLLVRRNPVGAPASAAQYVLDSFDTHLRTHQLAKQLQLVPAESLTASRCRTDGAVILH